MALNLNFYNTDPNPTFDLFLFVCFVLWLKHMLYFIH